MKVFILTSIVYLIGFIFLFIISYNYNKKEYKPEFRKEALIDALQFGLRWPQLFILIFGFFWIYIKEHLIYLKNKNK